MRDDLTVLDDRAAIAVTGPDARSFLQRLITNDVETLGPGQARYAALLSPQGKILTDFLVVALTDEAGFLLDIPTANAADLVKRLTLYRLRAKVTIEDRSAALAIVAFTGASPDQPLVLRYDDPRHPGLWTRGLLARTATAAQVSAAALAAFRTARIRAGVPEGGVDFAFGDTFPHDANLDHLRGVDFRKGCYVGQEVVSRVEHRGTARRRIVPAGFEGPPPAEGAEIMADGVAIGTMGGSIEGLGLALVRLDRAREASGPVTADGVVLRLTAPAWA